MEKSIILFVLVISSSLAVQVSYSDQIIADSIDNDNLPSALNKRATHPFDKTYSEVPTVPTKPKGGRRVGSIGRAATASATAGGAAAAAGGEEAIAGGEEAAAEEATAAGGEEAIAGGEEPAAGEATAAGGEEAIAGGEEPAAGVEEAIAGGEEPAAGEAAAAGGEEAIAGGEEPAAGEAAAAGGEEAAGATGGGAATVRGGATQKAAWAAGGATPKAAGVFRDVDIESRPKSPAKYFEWSYNKRPFPPLTETEFVYCPNETFVSGVSAMRYREPKVKYGIGMLRFSCATLAGDYVSDIYVGDGKIGTFGSYRRCKDENDYVAQGLDIDYHGDDCHPGVTDVGICGNLLPPEHPDTLEEMKCPRLTAVCGVAVRRDQLTLQKTQNLYAPCKSDKDNWGPVWSFTQVGMACCRANDPMEECIAKPQWKHLLSCRPPLSCAISLRSGFVTVNSNSLSKSESKTYTEMWSISADVTIKAFKGSVNRQFGTTQVNGKDISEALTSISSNDTTIDIALNDCDGSLKQFVVPCGFYQANSDIYECQPRGSVNPIG